MPKSSEFVLFKTVRQCYNELNKERKMRIQGSLAYVFAGCPCLFGCRKIMPIFGILTKLKGKPIMKWKEITIYTTEEGTEIILARLDMLGITQVNIVQGDEEIDALLHSCEKYWDYADEAAMGKQPSVQAYVSDVPENAAVEQAVRNSIAELDSMRSEIGIDMGSLKIEVRSVDEEDWANNWKAYFKPMPVGEKLLWSVLHGKKSRRGTHARF